MTARAEASISTQAERSALSDQKMFEVAIELVNERGTAKTTLKDIGEQAGYSRGLASYRFGSKDGLWMELFARFDELWKEHISRHLSDKRGLAALTAAMEAQRDIFFSRVGLSQGDVYLVVRVTGQGVGHSRESGSSPCHLSTGCSAVGRRRAGRGRY